jgi:DNA modification methylase
MESRYQLHHGDCLDVLKTLADCSVDAVVTDPPYGLSFMGKRWDCDVPAVEVWRECLRVLKPGGHLLAFAGTRTQHRMAVRIEDAGFEIRDLIAWVYGSGFPKSHDISKAVDKAAGAEREVMGSWKPTGTARPSKGGSHSAAKTTSDCGYDPDTEARINITAPATEAARQWQGWGTALKPAFEPVTMARKPLASTVAASVLEHGTGGLNVDGCRVGTDGEKPAGSGNRLGSGNAYQLKDYVSTNGGNQTHELGRWPANFIHDGSDEVLQLFPVTKSGSILPHHQQTSDSTKYSYEGGYSVKSMVSHGDQGSAARFFYTAKASKADRDAGCEAMEARGVHRYGQGIGEGRDPNAPAINRNHHPTVKPTDLMRYLCRLITPPGGVILDPFTGSGSTGKAAILEGFRFIGIEREAEYIEIARARIEREADRPRQPTLFD